MNLWQPFLVHIVLLCAAPWDQVVTRGWWQLLRTPRHNIRVTQQGFQHHPMGCFWCFFDKTPPYRVLTLFGIYSED